jgi:hypothetical protein
MDEVKDFSVPFKSDFTENIEPEKINDVVKDGFGFGTNVTNAIGNKQTAILDYEKLQSENLIEKDTYSDRRLFEVEGKSYTEVTSEINKSFGLDISVLEFKNTLKTATNNAMKDTDDYEYHVRLFFGKALGVTLRPVSDLASYVQDKALHDIAGIAENGVVAYPTNDKNKLKKLFDTYGTHIITKAIFGCRHQTYYMREAVGMETKIKKQVDYNLDSKFKIKDGLQDLGIKLGQSYEESYVTISNSENEKEFTQWIGGGSIDSFAQWESGMDFAKPTSIALIGYIMPGSTNESGLIPIWEIVKDAQRVQKMQEAYDEYLKEHATTLRKSKKIIVDAFGRHFSDGAPSTIYEKDYNGVLREFKRVDEEIMRHVKGVTKGSFYFYYAFSYATNGGLTEMIFKNTKDKISSPWQRRGDIAQDGVSGCLDDNILVIKPAYSSDYSTQDAYENDLISGFGVDVEGCKIVSSGAKTDMHWTTGGVIWYKGGLCHDDVNCIYTKDKI